MKITVRSKSLSENMGDGWHDNNIANRAFAKFLEDYLAKSIKQQYPSASVYIVITPIDNTGGDPGGPSVWVEDRAYPYEIEEDIRRLVIDDLQSAWDAWCDSDEAEKYIE